MCDGAVRHVLGDNRSQVQMVIAPRATGHVRRVLRWTDRKWQRWRNVHESRPAQRWLWKSPPLLKRLRPRLLMFNVSEHLAQRQEMSRAWKLVYCVKDR